ncbi:MAG TPA: SPASM domain-containing protein [Desulfomonilaceae bacterium]|nr:SPASM domain-containing protein [Desulfomonilaceae bacterium]
MFYYGLENDNFTRILTQFDFGTPEPHFEENLFGPNLRLNLLPVERIECGSKVLLLEKHTGLWCFLEPHEYQVFRSLESEELETVVAGIAEPHRAELSAFVGRLHWRGLLKINGRRFIQPDVFDTGPIFDRGWLFILVPTERCNLACKYCCADSNPWKQQRMDWGIAKKAIDLIVDYIPERATIEFAGGEPFLEPDLIERIVEYGRGTAEKRGKDLAFWAQSNGTLVSEDLLQRFEKLRISVNLSLDGDRVSNDMTRVFPGDKGTYSAITRAIALMQKKGGGKAAICVVSKANYRRLDKILAGYRELGMTGIKLNPVTRNGRASEEWQKLALEPAEFLEFHRQYLDMVSNGDCSIVDENTATMLDVIGSRMHPYRCMRSQCGAGRDFMTFAPNGDIYPCSLTRAKPKFRLGNIREVDRLNDIWKNNPIIAKLAERHAGIVISECRECSYKRFCEAGCPTASYEHFGRTDAPHPWCQYYRGIYRELFRRLAEGSRFVEIFCPHAKTYDNPFFM